MKISPTYDRTTLTYIAWDKMSKKQGKINIKVHIA
jgi:hypothetical protein